jgi:ubiquinone/menaquinone biosynthesis C-methylase UbiE
MPFDGERYTTLLSGTIEQEHLHRYLFALPFCNGREVLDIACGEGYGTALLGTVARRVVGVDISANTINHARQAYTTHNDGAPVVEFQTGSCEAIPLSNAAVDVVISFETIEHIKAHAEFLFEIRRVLRPGGTLIISTPDHQVYSIENGVQNPYHLRELTQHAFATALSQHFPYLTMLGQKSTAGSVIAPLPGVSKVSYPTQIILRRDGARYAVAPYLVGAPFLIGVASDQPIATLPVSILDDPGFIPQLEQIAVPQLQAEVVALKAKIVQLTKALSEVAVVYEGLDNNPEE